jgi:hypothetical protein
MLNMVTFIRGLDSGIYVTIRVLGDNVTTKCLSVLDAIIITEWV